MRYKPKIKYKLKAVVTAAFLSITAFATSLTASAVWFGTNAAGCAHGCLPHIILPEEVSCSKSFDIYDHK